MTWKPETFEVAMPWGVSAKTGYTYRGLGLWQVMAPSPKGRRPAVWSLTHLGSGHMICGLKGDVATAFPVATEIAEAGDWDFLSLSGWKDRFPDAVARIREILARYPKVQYGKVGGKNQHHETAMQIASNRA